MPDEIFIKLTVVRAKSLLADLKQLNVYENDVRQNEDLIKELEEKIYGPNKQM